MASKRAKLEKTISRQKERIASGDFYEAHQQLRTISARHTKAEDWDSAIEVLHNGALALLNAGQGGSGGDLGCLMVDVYNKSNKSVDSGSKGKLLSVLRAFRPEEPTRKKYINEMIQWSIKAGEFPNGDPELHHAAGTLYAEECQAYEAERHLGLGTRDSPDVLARMEYEWYAQDEPYTAALYCARCIFPYLLTKNLRSANKAFLIFTSRLSSGSKSLSVQEVSSQSSDMRVYPSVPLLNFLGLLLLAVQRGSADLYRQLAKHYAPHLREVSAWNDALAAIGETYFGIRIPRQGNPMLDMLGSMMGFGGGGGGGAPKPRPKKPDATSLPPAEGLD